MKQLATISEFPEKLSAAVKGRTVATGLNVDADLAFRETWALPAVTEDLKAQAAVALANLEGVKAASVDDKQKWVAALLRLCTGRKEPGDIEAKVVAYSAMLDYPSFAFTKTTLGKAAARFVWFPAFAELTQFLDSEVSEYRTLIRRLSSIADADIKRLDVKVQEPVEERRNHAAKVMASLKQKMNGNENE